MSEENKNVQETRDDKKEGNVLAGFVLYTDANMDWLRFKKFLKDDWNIVPQDDVKDNAMVFKVGDMVVACSLMLTQFLTRKLKMRQSITFSGKRAQTRSLSIRLMLCSL